MSKKSERFTAQHQATLLMCLVVASVIAAVSFSVGHIAGSVNAQPNQNEEQLNEETEYQPTTDDLTQAGIGHTTGIRGSVTPAGSLQHVGEYDHVTVPKRCYLVVGFTDKPPTIDLHNSMDVPLGICVQIAQHLLENP